MSVMMNGTIDYGTYTILGRSSKQAIGVNRLDD